MKYEEYAGREGDIVTGIIQQSDSRYTLLDLGRVEALLPQAEQVPYERPEPNTRVKAYIVEVRKTAKGPQIVVSRTHPGLIKRLFELEVPEIADGIVEIKACAREPGHRTKIAVWSNDTNVDPVGACVGARGARVRMVVNELNGEKIDIVPFSDDPADFVMKALSPAKVKEVRIHEDTGTAEVIVPDYQLSLAIGKEGQNARLAARLTGWRVDIKSETQLAEEEAYQTEDWAQGEWVVDPETGEQVWQPAEGGPAMTAEEWSQLGAEQAEAEDAETVAEDAAVAEAAVPAEDDAAAEDAPPPMRSRRPRRPSPRRPYRRSSADDDAADGVAPRTPSPRRPPPRTHPPRRPPTTPRRRRSPRHPPADLYRVPAGRRPRRTGAGDPSGRRIAGGGTYTARPGRVAVPIISRVLRRRPAARGLRPGPASAGRGRRCRGRLRDQVLDRAARPPESTKGLTQPGWQRTYGSTSSPGSSG